MTKSYQSPEILLYVKVPDETVFPIKFTQRTYV